MHIDPKQSLRLDVKKLPTPHWKKPLLSIRRTRGIEWLAVSSVVMMTGCNTMNTIDAAGDQFEKGEYGWGIYTSTIGVAVSLLADIFTLGGTADPETGVSTVMKGGYQAEAGDTSGALQTMSEGFASAANKIAPMKSTCLFAPCRQQAGTQTGRARPTRATTLYSVRSSPGKQQTRCMGIQGPGKVCRLSFTRASQELRKTTFISHRYPSSG